jgi:cell division protein ZapD
MTTSSSTSIAKENSATENSGQGNSASSLSVQPAPEKIIYEQPLSERIRTFLRLEYLFKQASYHLPKESGWDSRATLTCILEILDISCNTNLKSEALKELKRHSANLKRHEQNPDIDHAQLNALLSEISAHIEGMHKINGQIANDLKTSEFLVSIRKRCAIPGGTCDFDLPAFHYWLQQPAKERTRDLSFWLGNFDAIGRAIQLILKLTRDSTALQLTLARNGVYQRTLDANRPCQLVRIALEPELPYFAELSGGRHRFTARFMQYPAVQARAKQTDQDVEFELACCVI